MNHYFSEINQDYLMHRFMVDKLRLESQGAEKVLVQRDEDRNHECNEIDNRPVDQYVNNEIRDTAALDLDYDEKLNCVELSQSVNAKDITNTVEDLDDVSVFSYATYDTNGTTESSVYDIISRLHSETMRRRRRLARRRSGREEMKISQQNDMRNITTIEE